MNGNPLFNLESGQVLETTFEEDILSTGLGDESFIISPVVVGNTSTNRVDRDRGSKELDQTLLGDSKEDSHENQDKGRILPRGIATPWGACSPSLLRSMLRLISLPAPNQ